MSEPAASASEPTYPVVDFAPLDPRVHDDYWNVLTEVREKCPVGWSTSQWSMTESGQWIINTHRDVMAAATDWQTFSSADGVSSVQLPLDILRLIPVETDPPTHREIRKALNPFFTPYALEEKVGEINEVVAGLLEGCLAQEGPVDFVSSFTAKLPPVVFLGPGFLDSTEEQGRQLLELVDIMLTKPELTMEAAPKLLAWCGELLESRRAAGRKEDLAGVIAHMGFGEGGLHMDEKQRIETINLAVMAGMETTMGGLGATAWLLGTRPELRARLRDADERTIDRAIEEFLRFATPVSQLSRTATKDVEMGGCPIQKGDRVMLNWAAANLDPAQFPDPLTIDIDRPNVASHVAFGSGIHRCLGAHLARREIKAMVRAICALSRFEVVPDAEIKWRASMARGPVAVPVLLAR
ncbi:cytochrome P450 [Sporichthya brevicatena]|uniref:Cytochrome P450 n=1 Tax=Sporichthya brevicatena TaxID=171442 RepID=A0ABN1H4R1_9ACTN